MAQNLRARLSRIRKTASEPNTKAQRGQEAEGWGIIPPGFSAWQEAGYKVLRRTLTLPFDLPAVLPDTLPALVPDCLRRVHTQGMYPESNSLHKQLVDLTRSGIEAGASPNAAVSPDPGQFLFFDLETTGLSGGAGTVAFLAAFGRFVRGPSGKQDNRTQKAKHTGNVKYTGIEITQFLLLDYPGEQDFLQRVLSTIAPPNPETPYFLTTYNGKAFDTQILKTRCLLNGFALPPFLQADLLHPARRLWKRLLPNCSQGTIETLVLGLDRTGDTPGSLAPDIWFNFLRSGGDFAGTDKDMPEPCRALLGICDHNVKDIFGLASVFRAFAEIAAAPLAAAARFHCDQENLALSWRRLAQNFADEDSKAKTGDHAKIADHTKTAALLLEAAAARYPRACLRLGFAHMRQGRHEEGRAALQRLAAADTAWKVPCGITVQALALRSLAIDAKRRLDRQDLALAYIEKALALEQPAAAGTAGSDAPQKLPHGLREDLEKRREGIKKEADFSHTEQKKRK